MNPFQDAFISYGRADSLEFATWLNQRLMAEGFTVWFDYEDIPKAVPFQKQIDDGIVKADNFLCIVSPRSINSYNCQLEVQHAIACGKRIIPIIHVEQITYETWRSRHPQSSDDEWATFQAEGKHDYFINMPPILRELNWLNCRDGIEDREAFVQELLPVMHQNRDYVHRHTELLVQAQEWERHHKQTHFLLTGDRCEQGLAWLKTQLKQSQHPCSPTELQCEFITESLKNANNLMTQVFLAYAHEDKALMEQVRRSLWREGIVVWVNTNASDIQAGEDFQQAIDQGIEQADNLIYLLSPHALASEQCGRELSYAQALHKRIVPILVSEIGATQDPDRWLERHYIDLTGHATEDTDDAAISKLLRDLETDADYYQTHKELLVKALKWKHQHRNPSILLRGHDLRQAEIWLKTAQTRDCHLPTALHIDFLEESLRQPPASSLDVFISYSRADADFARKLNDNLQIYGKTTWFDQESIAKASGDFVQEIRRGIDVSNNIVFILSPRSVQSPFCQDEVAYAASLNKRFVTILHQDLGEAVLPAALQTVQWLDFTQTGPNRFWEDFNQLVRVLETDREYLQSHTKWLRQAIAWEQQQRSQDLLLRGSEFAIADKWLRTAKTEEKKPVPTELQTAFIQASAQAIDAEKRREKLYRFVVRLLLGVMTASTCVVLGTTILASTSRRQAIHNEIKALAAIAEAEFALGQSFDAVVTALKAEDRLRHAHWLRHDQALRDRVTTALQQAVYLGRETHRIEGFDDAVMQTQFGPDGSLVTLDQTFVQLWQADGSPKLAADGTPIPPLEVQGSVMQQADSMAVNSTTGDILLISANSTPGHERFIQRWNSQGEALPTLIPDTSWAWVHISPDGQTFVTSDGDRLQLWNIDGTPRLDLPKSQAVNWAVFSHDHQTLLAPDEDSAQIRFWNLQDGTHTTLALPDDLYPASWNGASTDGDRIVLSDGDELHLHQTDGTQLLTLEQSQTPTNAVVADVLMSPDQQTIAAIYNFQQVNRDPFVRLWNAQGEFMASLDGHNADIMSLTFSPNSTTLATASAENIVKLWQTDGTLMDTLLGHADQITSMSFSADGTTLATGSWDDTLRLWNVNAQLAQRSSVDAHFVSPDGSRWVTAITDGPVSLWQANGQRMAQLQAKNAGALQGAWSGNSEFFVSFPHRSSTSYGPVQVWNAQGELQSTLMEPTATEAKNTQDLLRVNISQAGDRILTIEQTDNTYGPVKLWHRDGQLLATLLEPFDKSLSGWYDEEVVIFSPETSTIITKPTIDNSYGPVQLWDRDGQLIQTLIEEQTRSQAGYVYGEVNVSENGATILTTLTTDATFGPVELWNPQGQKQATLLAAMPQPLNEDSRYSLQQFLSPDGQTLITRPFTADKHGPTQLWNAQGKLLATLMPETSIAEDSGWGSFSVFYSPTSDTFVTQWQQAEIYGPVVLWSQTGEPITTLIERSPLTAENHDFFTQTLFSEDGQTLIAALLDGTLQRWQTHDGALLNRLPTTFESSMLLAEGILSPDATLLALPANANTVEIWDIQGQQLATIRGDGDYYRPEFSRDSQLFAVGNYDNQVRLWHREHNSVVTLGGHDATPHPQFLDVASGKLATTDSEQIILHQLDGLTDLDKLVAMGCERVAMHLQHGAEVEESDRALCQGKLP
ncbi:MAG: TIR domain-containing protein [Leptolyngbya sp. SIOISBB]|nr:TIR domain-containing protein [Leptolyngbya sp. SIOISBB]